LTDKELLGLEEGPVEGMELVAPDGLVDKESAVGVNVAAVDGTELDAIDGLTDKELLGLEEGPVEGMELVAPVESAVGVNVAAVDGTELDVIDGLTDKLGLEEEPVEGMELVASDGLADTEGKLEDDGFVDGIRLAFS